MRNTNRQNITKYTVKNYKPFSQGSNNYFNVKLNVFFYSKKLKQQNEKTNFTKSFMYMTSIE